VAINLDRTALHVFLIMRFIKKNPFSQTTALGARGTIQFPRHL